MEKTGTEFLNRLYKDMHMSDVVMHTASPSDKPSDKIEKYLNRLERVHTKAKNHSTDVGIRLLKKFYYDHYVIKPENISNKYWQFLDSQYFNQRGVHMTEEEKFQHIQTIISDQKKSLDKWIDYLSSEDTRFYPTWAKYWAFQGMLNIGAYDNKNDVYKKRDKSTVAPFVDLNQEALAKVIDMVVQSVNQEQIEEVFQKLVENGNFRKLYTLLLSQGKAKVMSNTSTSGVWKKYEMGSDYHPLWESLQGKNTGWCTAGANTCKTQIAGGDFYVYYTFDEKGEATNPRLAIRMDGKDRIGEIRGIAKNQNIEPNFEEIVEEKIKDFPDRDKYKKRLHDTKMLTAVYKKYQNHEMFTKDDLLFIYGNVEGCGWQNDPRLNELRDVAFTNASDEMKSDYDVVRATVQQNGIILQYAGREMKSNLEIVMAAVQQNGIALQYASEEMKSNPEIVMTAVQQNYQALAYASKELKDNPKIVTVAIQQNGSALASAGMDVRNNPEIIMIAVQKNGESLQYASDEIKTNAAIVMEAVKQNYNALQYASDEMKSNPTIVMEAVKQSYNALQYASGDLKSNLAFMLEAVQQNGFALAYASEELKSNSEIVMASVQQNYSALQYASDEIKSNPEIVMEAVKQNYNALEYASDAIKSNPTIVMEAVKQNYNALQYASDAMKSNHEIILEAVKQNYRALEYAGKELKSNPEIFLEAVKQNYSALQYAGEELKSNSEFFLEAVKQDYRTFEYAGEEPKNNSAVVMEVVKQDGYSLVYASDAMKSNLAIVKEAVKQNYNVFQYASEELRNNPEIVIEAVKQDGFTLQYAGIDVRNNPEIIMIAVQEDGESLQYASEEMKSNPAIVMAAVKQNYNAWEYATDEVKKDSEVVMTAIQSFNNLVNEYKKDHQINFNDLNNAIEDFGTPLRSTSAELRKNPEFMLEAVKVCEYVMIDADPRLKHDKQFILKAIQANPNVYLGEEWKNDIDIKNAITQEKEKREKSEVEQPSLVSQSDSKVGATDTTLASLSINPIVSNELDKEALANQIVEAMVNRTIDGEGKPIVQAAEKSSKAKGYADGFILNLIYIASVILLLLLVGVCIFWV